MANVDVWRRPVDAGVAVCRRGAPYFGIRRTVRPPSMGYRREQVVAAVRTVIGLGAQVRIYYDDADVQVTSWAVWVRGYRYGLADLDRVWRQDTAVVSRRVVSGVGVLAVVLVAKAATSAVFAVAGLALGLPATAAALYAVEDLRRYGRRRELWASVRGLPVLLVRTDDALRYGRLCRSVARAMEDFRARPRCERR